ncbi:MAG TPA: single-stranded-DNA-specific exonuclease RecJ [Thermoleophilaceae bacterium]|nr:single-stranded-DNA-specific exonuclease RecJ [Thermoleophilaceae bacterium]
MACVEPGTSWTCDIYPVERALRLCDALNVSPTTAAILVRRGYADVQAARAFLSGTERSDPLELPGTARGAALLLGHVRAGSRIVVFGDYDVDGVCSTAMMVRALRSLGAEPGWRLPSRGEGYGLSLDAVSELAAAGTRLLVTVDCGVTSTAEVELATELGMEVLVTDHHRPAEALPACPIVHPGLGEAPSSELCAAGVVLKLSEALRVLAGRPAGEEDIELAGLATVCDMVPLLGENRRIAREGMEELRRTRRPGLRALMEVAGLDAGDADARAAGFRLGPRLNAAGRLQRADAALELLLTEDGDRAGEVARELDGLNHERRETEQRILHAADAACAGQMSAAAMVVAGDGWHPGVVGIVASRLVERHRRPCVVIGLDGDTGRGSGRSISAYDLHAGLAAAADGLLRFGGHRMAAGLEVRADQVDRLRRTLAAHAGERLAPADLLRVQHVDAVVPGGALSLHLAEELERLGPFGAGNPEPVLMVPSARIEHVTAMGEERTHARFSLVGGGARARGVAFRTSQRALSAAGAQPQHVAVGLERNRWNGAVEARVVLRSLSAAQAGQVRELASDDFWDELDSELDRDPSAWWPSAGGGSARREVRDRRHEGFAGVAGDLLTSGETVLVVVADAERRRASLEGLVAGLAPDGLAVASWSAMGADTGVAEAHTHLVALDPPPVEHGVDLLAAAPGAGLVHLAWGAAECEFARAHWRAQLDLRPSMAELWRALAAADGGSLDGEALATPLRGNGAYPRGGALCGRLLRVLGELGLAAYDRAGRTCDATGGVRTDLALSPAHRAYAARLREAEAYLSLAGQPLAEPTRARVG